MRYNMTMKNFLKCGLSFLLMAIAMTSSAEGQSKKLVEQSMTQMRAASDYDSIGKASAGAYAAIKAVVFEYQKAKKVPESELISVFKLMYITEIKDPGSYGIELFYPLYKKHSAACDKAIDKLEAAEKKRVQELVRDYAAMLKRGGQDTSN